jgi:hypothetical protein
MADAAAPQHAAVAALEHDARGQPVPAERTEPEAPGTVETPTIEAAHAEPADAARLRPALRSPAPPREQPRAQRPPARQRERAVATALPEPQKAAEREAAAPLQAAPPVRIESIEVVVERPPARPARPRPAPAAAPAASAALARGFSSLIGLRQG